MVVIRLARGGAKKRPFYHVVATDHHKPRDCGYIERLGYFNPVARGLETRLKLNSEQIALWLAKGAKPSARVAHLLKEYEKSGGDEGSAGKEEGGSGSGTPTLTTTKEETSAEPAIEDIITHPENPDDATSPETAV